MAEGLKEDAMINLIYVEEDVRQHPRTKQIIARFPKATVLTCQHHKEIFNPSAQNFRLQKKNPALIGPANGEIRSPHSAFLRHRRAK